MCDVKNVKMLTHLCTPADTIQQQTQFNDGAMSLLPTANSCVNMQTSHPWFILRHQLPVHIIRHLFGTHYKPLLLSIIAVDGETMGNVYITHSTKQLTVCCLATRTSTIVTHYTHILTDAVLELGLVRVRVMIIRKNIFMIQYYLESYKQTSVH